MMPIDMDTGENQVPGEWKVLSSGCAAGIVLTIDFEAVGRPEACFSDLAAMLGPSREVWAATELPSGTDAAARASAYLQHWTRDLRDGGREVSAVLGFCAGGVFAAALADEIAQWQAEPPAAILLDPEVPTSATLVKQLENATRGLEQAGSETGLAKARETAARLGSTEDLPSLGRKLTFLYHELSEPVFAQIGLDAEDQADLVQSFGSLMSYLAAAAELRPGRRGKRPRRWCPPPRSGSPPGWPARSGSTLTTPACCAAGRWPGSSRRCWTELAAVLPPATGGPMVPFTQLVADVLELPVTEVNDELGPATTAEWTSIKHLQLIAAAEENYGLSFSRAEIRAVRTVGDLRRGLASRGVVL
jgi:acyl carrier protein